MPSSRSRRSRDEDDEYDDRPRRSRRDDEDDDERPRSRRSRGEDDDDDYDDRPRRRRRRDEDDDYDDRPRSRRPRRRSRGPSTGLILGILGGIAAIVGVVVLIVFLTGRSNISYEKFKAISSSDTIESLEKKFGTATKLDRSEWSSVRYGERGGRSATLADVQTYGTTIDGWYRWKKGSEEIYVAQGKGPDGKTGLLLKLYLNPDALKANRGKYDPSNPGDISKYVPEYEFWPLF